MPTPLSNPTAYASVDDMLACHDARKVGELVNDSSTRVTPGGLATNPVLLFAIQRASGDVEQACFVSHRYEPADLLAMTGMGQIALKGLVCDLAFWHLTKRRYTETSPEDCPGAQQALNTLDLLRKGERVFGLQEQMDAASVEAVTVTEQDLQRAGNVVVTAERYFGVRNSRNRWW